MNRVVSVESEGPYMRYVYDDGHQQIIEKWPELRRESHWGELVFWVSCGLCTLFTVWITIYLGT